MYLAFDFLSRELPQCLYVCTSHVEYCMYIAGLSSGQFQHSFFAYFFEILLQHQPTSQPASDKLRFCFCHIILWFWSLWTYVQLHGKHLCVKMIKFKNKKHKICEYIDVSRKSIINKRSKSSRRSSYCCWKWMSTIQFGRLVTLWIFHLLPSKPWMNAELTNKIFLLKRPTIL